MNRVEELLRRKRRDIALRKAARGAIEPPREDRRISWKRDGFRILAEVKRASLSAGSIRPDLDLARLVREYQRAGADAVSVLTEEHFFGGSISDLRIAASVATVPLLQKDFVLDRFQVAEAKEAGASFVLLIARFLPADEISSLQDYCDEIGINCILEVTSESDLKKIRRPARYLGVNSRDLQTLRVDLSRFARLRPMLPDAFLIAESGIASLRALKEVIDSGYDAALIGEYFLRAEEPAEELSRFVRVAKRRPRVKICGITNHGDARLAIDAGASALGFIFAESPRKIDPAELRRFRAKIPGNVLCVGVFKGQEQEEIRKTMETFELDVAQVYLPSAGEPPALPHVWLAKQLSASTDAAVTNGLPEEVLWDVKVHPEQLPAVWKELGKRPVFALAGGLTADNVRRGIELCRPEWVDVARGVEKVPGIKDEAKLRAFMRNVL